MIESWFCDHDSFEYEYVCPDELKAEASISQRKAGFFKGWAFQGPSGGLMNTAR